MARFSRLDQLSNVTLGVLQRGQASFGIRFLASQLAP